jgi:tetratricopeptide (TPR) repeat protein
MAVLAGAGSVIWGTIGEDVKLGIAQARLAMAPKPPAPVPAKPRPPVVGTNPIDDEEIAFWSNISIYKAGPARPTHVVVAERGKQPTRVENYAIDQGLLAREVVLQGLLLAAREELGALTRDVPIGDPGLKDKPDVTFRIGSQFRRPYQLQPGEAAQGRITIVQGEGDDRKVIWARQFDCQMAMAPEFGRLAGQVEGFSRKEFRDALEGLGLKRATPAPAFRRDVTLPEGVEAGLMQPVETEQFAAIRALHAEVRRRGESKALLLALARAYAYVGSLSEGQWTSDTSAFKARALLYVRRAIASDEEDPANLRELAYVEAVVGLFYQSIHHLGEADEIDKKSGKPGPALPGIEMIRAYIGSDRERLGAMASSKPDEPWPAYFRFLSMSRASGSIGGFDRLNRHEIIEAGRAILRRVPDCYRVHESMAALGGVSNLHRSTTEGAALYGESIARRVAAMPGLPAAVAVLVDDGSRPDEVSLRRALADSAEEDPSDLTWGVLARQLREIRFAQACQRVHFLVYWLNVSPAEFAEQAALTLADHPSRSYVASFASVDAETFRDLRAIDLGDIPFNAHKMVTRLAMIDPVWSAQSSGLAWAHSQQGTAPGHASRILNLGADGVISEAHNLRKLDPESPLGRGAMISFNWDVAAKDAEAWRKDHGGTDTFVLGNLGLKFLEAGKDDEAQLLLEDALKRSPELWIFDGLADIYLKSGQIDKWIAATEDFVKGEDTGLDHSRALSGLVKFLMAKGDFARALPYAERAAASWSGDSMLLAAKCADAMQDWEKAEVWIRRLSERYTNSWLHWVYWCKRTGHGDARAASELVEAHLAAGRVPSTEELLQVAIVLILDGKPAEARTLLAPRFEAIGDTTDGSVLALACELAGDTAGRDAALKAVGESKKPTGPKTAKLMGKIGDWLAKGDPDALDMEAIKADINDLGPQGWPATCAILAPFLDRHGKQEAAHEYLNLANSDQCYSWLRLITLDAIRAKGDDPGIFAW